MVGEVALNEIRHENTRGAGPLQAPPPHPEEDPESGHARVGVILRMGPEYEPHRELAR